MQDTAKKKMKTKKMRNMLKKKNWHNLQSGAITMQAVVSKFPNNTIKHLKLRMYI